MAMQAAAQPSAGENAPCRPAMYRSTYIENISAQVCWPRHTFQRLNLPCCCWRCPCCPLRSLQSVLDEMAGVLEDSGRSMRELSTDTKEQQREWWRARWVAWACRRLMVRCVVGSVLHSMLLAGTSTVHTVDACSFSTANVCAPCVLLQGVA
jgi:hypothetical protein